METKYDNTIEKRNTIFVMLLLTTFDIEKKNIVNECQSFVCVCFLMMNPSDNKT